MCTLEIRVELFGGLNELMWGVQSLEQRPRHGKCSVIVSCFYVRQGTLLRPKFVKLFLKIIFLLSPGVDVYHRNILGDHTSHFKGNWCESVRGPGTCSSLSYVNAVSLSGRAS